MANEDGKKNSQTRIFIVGNAKQTKKSFASKMKKHIKTKNKTMEKSAPRKQRSKDSRRKLCSYNVKG